jgi:hypothetical protein
LQLLGFSHLRAGDTVVNSIITFVTALEIAQKVRVGFDNINLFDLRYSRIVCTLEGDPMPSVISNPKADELIAPAESLDMPPTSRPANITTLIESVDRYNPESLQALEEYLAQQCADGTFDCLADLAILKLYGPYSAF